MVQLSPSSPGGNVHLSGVAKHQSERGLSSLQSSLSSTATPLQVYETYLENGFISLKHKIRNIEKKKVKLEDYRDRLHNGEDLNQDQLEAVERYSEVLHNLEFAKELQKVFAALSQDLIKAQKKVQRREQIQKTEAEKKRLRMVLQIQYVLQSFCQDHVQQDFKDGLNGAMNITSKELDGLSKFSKLLCHKRFQHMSLEDEMDQMSVYLWNLVEGNEKTVAGTNYKFLKDLVSRMLDCGYFESVPDPPRKEPQIVLVEPPKTETCKVTRVEPEPFKEHLKLDPKSPRELPIRHCVPKVEQVPKAAEMPKPVQVKYMSPEPIKPWTVATNVKLQEPPKRWQSPSLTPLTKTWQTTNVPQPAAPQPKGELETPKERRERAPKPQQEVKAVTQLKDPKMPPVPSVQITVKKRDIPAPICINHLSPAVTNAQPHRVTAQPASEFCYSPTLPKDPELRKQKLEDLIDQIKGTYNFMQDSMLDFDSQSSRAASPGILIEVPVVPSEPIESPKEPTLPNGKVSTPPVLVESIVDPVCLILEPDSPLPLSSPVKQVPDSPPRKVEPLVPEPIYVPSPPLPEPLPERSLTPVPLQTEPLQSPKTPTSVPLLQLKREGTPLSTRSTPQASPFQGMQAVFKVNPPLPSRKEIDIKDDPPYPPEYQQTFSTASTQTLPHGLLDLNGGEPHTLIQEPLVGGPYNSAMPPVTNGNLPCYTSTPNLVPRIPQQCTSTRGGIIRGVSRGARVMTNGYRQTSFKGPETYRGTPCPSSGSYGPVPYPGRDYPVPQYIPRDANSHLCYKRGSITPAGRSTPRSWNDSAQLGSPEMEESFNSTDSGQGDSRSMTSVDMSMSSQAATILPVHVYPLPQQMRVAFSAARTSNFAPGTLDQPIVFDLLLNNLGDTFDFQVGRFMCPVNGTYVFIFHMLKLAVNVPLYVNLMKNEEVMVSAYANDGAPDHETASNHAVLQLFQGDQIWLRLHRGAIYGSSWKYSTFSGYLLYQD
ncbi:caprin-2 isoform X1 [Engystomops pustulosus]|uniref:caprin-2 isoform X1 n=1 Tax=Engystomops pustulosus TaxID=76066 RepID=UPI003AFA6289